MDQFWLHLTTIPRINQCLAPQIVFLRDGPGLLEPRETTDGNHGVRASVLHRLVWPCSPDRLTHRDERGPSNHP